MVNHLSRSNPVRGLRCALLSDRDGTSPWSRSERSRSSAPGAGAPSTRRGCRTAITVRSRRGGRGDRRARDRAGAPCAPSATAKPGPPRRSRPRRSWRWPACGPGRSRPLGGDVAGGSIWPWARARSGSAWTAARASASSNPRSALRAARAAARTAISGGAASSGVARSRRRLSARPSPSWPLAQEIGIASTRPKIVGLIQRNSEVAIAKAATPATSPSSVCHRWRTTMSRSGIETVVPPLRIPTRVPSEQDAHHGARLDHHRHRRHEGGQQDLDEAGQDQPPGAPAGAPHRAVQQGQDQAEELGCQQDRHGEAEQLERADRIEAREDRREAGAAEIVRPLRGRLQNQQDTDHQLQQPERRGRGSRRCRWRSAAGWPDAAPRRR